ncbi:MAG TPA: SIS domain-containing protein [Longimicrobiales bacterium]|nr:SIS domain-containing protein [Longimicrobiales bacterium]
MTIPAVDAATQQLTALADLATRVAREMAGQIAALAELASSSLADGHKLMFCGNGGSAADAQHLATEYVVRFREDRGALPALALTTDTSLLTAAANDYGFEHVFARQVEALGRPGDVLFLHSTSGESPNLLRAAEVARGKGVVTVAMLARGGGALAGAVDHALVLPTREGARAQELHLAIGHIICAVAEERLNARNRSRG